MSRIEYDKEDKNFNYIRSIETGLHEARYVERDNYMIAYLSTFNGCNKACRFCHLTQTNQTMMRECNLHELKNQANTVLRLGKHEKFTRVNFNFMARGEPLSSKLILKHWPEVNRMLKEQSSNFRMNSVSLISTIMPTEVEDINLYDIFGDTDASIYYSLYSLDAEFRRRWIPKSIDPHKALWKLVDYQQKTGKLITLHFPFIEGENDSEESLESIIQAINVRNLTVKFNLVRYNSYSSAQGNASSDNILDRNFKILSDAFGHESRIVERVSPEIKLSCGMFVAE